MIRTDRVIAFWSHVEKTDGCWNWTGAKQPNGYGRFHNPQGSYLAHRISYELTTGRPVPDGLLVDHVCHNRLCVRPSHLRPATRKQNGENRSPAATWSNSGYRGVSWEAGRKAWRVRVMHNGRFVHVGYFDDVETANRAAIAARADLFTHSHEVSR